MSVQASGACGTPPTPPPMLLPGPETSLAWGQDRSRENAKQGRVWLTQALVAQAMDVQASDAERTRHGADLAAYDAAWLALMNGLAAARGAYGSNLHNVGEPAIGGGKGVRSELLSGGESRVSGSKAGLGFGPGLATRVADVPLLPPAPWNRQKPGHLVCFLRQRPRRADLRFCNPAVNIAKAPCKGGLIDSPAT